MPRIHCPGPLIAGTAQNLPEGAARHVQVLRMQPGQALTLFDGQGLEAPAEILQMGRSHVSVQIGAAQTVSREAPVAIHLAVGVPAGDRMDWLVEKATEMGVASIQPLFTERSVLRLKGERAAKKQAHWQAVAVAACEQCGRNQVPPVAAPLELTDWLTLVHAQPPAGARLLLSLAEGSRPLRAAAQGPQSLHFLSGPEGGLSPQEENRALTLGWTPVGLGPRILRAETAPLMVLGALLAP